MIEHGVPDARATETPEEPAQKNKTTTKTETKTLENIQIQEGRQIEESSQIEGSSSQILPFCPACKTSAATKTEEAKRGLNQDWNRNQTSSEQRSAGKPRTEKRSNETSTSSKDARDARRQHRTREITRDDFQEDEVGLEELEETSPELMERERLMNEIPQKRSPKMWCQQHKCTVIIACAVIAVVGSIALGVAGAMGAFR